MMATAGNEDVFSQLHEYNFLGDQRFLAGWQQLRKNLHKADPSELTSKYLQAKIFYFSKYIAPVSVEEYLQWVQKKEDVKDLKIENGKTESIASPDSSVTREGTDDVENRPGNSTEQVETVVNDTLQESTEMVSSFGEISLGEDSGVDTVAAKYPKSFYELLELVEQGDSIPGVEALNIEPTNAEPTKSCIDRICKPWEKVS